MISVEVVHDKTSAVAIRHERDSYSSAPSVASGLSSSVFHREHRCNSQAWFTGPTIASVARSSPLV